MTAPRSDQQGLDGRQYRICDRCGDELPLLNFLGSSARCRACVAWHVAHGEHQCRECGQIKPRLKFWTGKKLSPYCAQCRDRLKQKRLAPQRAKRRKEYQAADAYWDHQAERHM